LATAIGCPLAPMLHALREYRGEAHRVEHVARIGDVDAFDDSKGTNVGATVAALVGLGAERAPAKLVVILGGDGKGQDFAPLAGPLAQHARAVLTIGRDAETIEHAIAGAGVPFARCATLEAAVDAAFARALPGDGVLLSPACASLDMFRNYAHRAEVFVEAVRELGRTAVAEDALGAEFAAGAAVAAEVLEQQPLPEAQAPVQAQEESVAPAGEESAATSAEEAVAPASNAETASSDEENSSPASEDASAHTGEAAAASVSETASVEPALDAPVPETHETPAQSTGEVSAQPPIDAPVPTEVDTSVPEPDGTPAPHTGDTPPAPEEGGHHG
ncbi:MAG TPA: cyanophycin synthetase, partial [Burkholderiales bacterium]